MRTKQTRSPLKKLYILGAGASFSASVQNRKAALKFPRQTPLDSQFTKALIGWEISTPYWIRESINRILSGWKDSTPFEKFGLEQAILRHLGNSEFLETAHPRRLRGMQTVDEYINDISHLITASLFRAKEGRNNTYGHFADIFKQEGSIETSKIITFNYDTLLDSHLLNFLRPQQLYFDKIKDRRNASSRRTRGVTRNPALLKLHGSINWRCTTGEFSTCLLRQDFKDSEPIFIDVWLSRGNPPQPKDRVSPLIVPPIPNKPITSIKLFRYLWTRAFEYLCDTEELVVCGYSLPDTDLLAVSLFGTFENDNIKKITVIDPNPQTLIKWRSLLNRKGVNEAEWTYFDDFSSYVHREYRRLNPDK